MTQSRVIGVTGGSGSGKTTFVRLLHKNATRGTCAVISQDHYYIDQSAIFRGDGENVNFDHPSALDFPLLSRHLSALKQGKSVEIPIYDFVTHKREPETQRFSPCSVIILDGTLILSQPEIRALMDVSVFIDTSEELRLSRRLERDTVERGRNREGVLKQFSRQVKPMHDQFVEPSKVFATHVISGAVTFEPEIADWARKLLSHEAG